MDEHKTMALLPQFGFVILFEICFDSWKQKKEKPEKLDLPMLNGFSRSPW